MKNPVTICLFAFLAMTISLAAQGPPQIPLTSIQVHASIVGNAVDVQVKGSFFNLGKRRAEGIWVFPLPPGAVIYESNMMVDDRPLKGKTLEVRKAREIYRSFVARDIDPLLVEQADWEVIRVRAYPVPANNKMDFKLSMTWLLPLEENRWRFTFPLKEIPGNVGSPIKTCFTMDITGPNKRRSVRINQAKTEVFWRSWRRERIGVNWRKLGKNKDDFTVTLPRQVLPGICQAVYNTAEGGRGEACFTFVLPPEPAVEGAGKTLILVADTSASMRGEKLAMVQGALRLFISRLQPADKFNLLAFNGRTTSLFPGPRGLTLENYQLAMMFISSMEAAGGSDLGRAMGNAVTLPASTKRPFVVLLGDGRPTMGELRPERIVRRVHDANRQKARIFTLSPGLPEDQFMLERLAIIGRGRCLVNKDINALKRNSLKVMASWSQPLVRDLDLFLNRGLFTRVALPPSVGVFGGEPLRVLGRFWGVGPQTLIVRGWVGREQRTWRFPINLPYAREDNHWVQALWVSGMMRRMMTTIRLWGKSPELERSIFSTAMKYGLVTPWTSHLVDEDDIRDFRRTLAAAKPKKKEKRRQRRSSRAVSKGNSPFAAGTVGGGAGSGFYGPSTPSSPGTPASPASPGGPTSPSTPATPASPGGPPGISGGRVSFMPPEISSPREKALQGKVFKLTNGIWVDRECSLKILEHARQVVRGSNAYYELIEVYHLVAWWSKLGDRVLLVLDGLPYLLVEKGGKGVSLYR